MARLAFLIWTMAAPTLMGVLVVAVLNIPALSSHDMKYMLPAAILGAVLAAPISYFIAKKLTDLGAA